MSNERIIITAVIVAAVIVIGAVVYVYRDKLKKALEQPRGTLEFLKAEMEEFFNQDSTKSVIKALCRLADRVVAGDGGDRLAFVCGKLFELVPDYLQSVITIEKLQEVVNLIYNEIKVYVGGHWVAGE